MHFRVSDFFRFINYDWARSRHVLQTNHLCVPDEAANCPSEIVRCKIGQKEIRGTIKSHIPWRWLVALKKVVIIHKHVFRKALPRYVRKVYWALVNVRSPKTHQRRLVIVVLVGKND